MGAQAVAAEGEDERGPARLRRRVHRALNPEGRLTATARFLIFAILAATVFALAETEPMLTEGREPLFRWVELAFALVFSIEYALRLWSVPESGRSRLRWIVSPTALIDLIAILASVLPFLGANAMLLRLLRVLRILRIARLGGFSRAFTIMERAMRARASHLGVTLVLSLFFLVVGATLIYLIEGDAQPDKFGSIPRSLWWTAVTMTTVGYGDVVPATPLGKLMAALISTGGIVLIAIPTGIVAASFSDEFAEADRSRAEAAAATAEAAAASLLDERAAAGADGGEAR
jgi:voltage-gated potassium channel